MLYLQEDESFSMQANVTSPGYQRIALKGYLVSRRADGTYIAPLIPQLFYGWDGTQLSSWRQNIGATGSQTILSRAAGGYPEVPRQELYWRKVSDFEEEVTPTPTPTVVPTRLALEVPSWVLPLVIGIGATALILYLWSR